MIRFACLALFMSLLAACASVPFEDTPTRAAPISDSSLPPMKTFSSPRPAPPARSNRDIAADFLSLHFVQESGRSLPRFTRFETPVTVRVTGNPPPTMLPDLRRLIARLRGEAGIDIRLVSSSDANITIVTVSRAELRRAQPDAACFVVPNVSSLSEFRRKRRSPDTAWSNLDQRRRMGIFIPGDTSPQEVRDCLHEELAQALGPVNDLYRLRDSIFNDDNVHAVLTGFDMLILRATYAPELRSGMSREQVAARLPGILARLNPRGERIAPQPVRPTPRDWIDAIETALGPGTVPPARRNAARRAIAIAEREGWTDHRRAFGYFIMGRMTEPFDPDLAREYFRTAMRYLEATPGTELHRANVTARLAADAISRGNAGAALARLDPAIATAARYENAALLATLMLLKAEALDLAGQTRTARAIRLDSLGWARYGFGSDWAVRARMREIAALNPLEQPG